MDYEKRAKRQSLRIIFSEFVMFLAVVSMVVVLGFVVSGYWINGDLKVERQGMLQINSIPTGLNITIDDELLRFQHTNSSKILSSGEHTVLLSKEGYDTWTKTVTIREGLLYRLNYPYLFRQEREKEDVYDATGTTFATVSPNRNLILLINKTTNWTLINLDSTTIKPIAIDISKVFSSVSLATGAASGLFMGEILATEWDNANEHILFKVKNGESIEWVLSNVRNAAKSVNLTREFASNFEDIRILDSSASNLLAMRNGNLHKVDVESRQISAILASGVIHYDYYDNEIIYSTEEKINLLKLGDEKATPIEELEAPATLLLSKFYEDKYITVIRDLEIIVYKKDDLTEVARADLSFAPNYYKIGHDGDFIFLRNGNQLATFDMEALALREWSPESEKFGWITNYMIYTVKNNELIVYDYDGLNRRSISTNVSAHFPVTITNNRWMYYFNDDGLVREWLIPR
jgi:hypothetical protein